MPDSVLFARQPILNRKREIIGYELLFRNNKQDTSAHFHDSSKASAEVMLSSLTGLDVNKVINNKRAFINVPLEILDEIPRIAQDRWAIEVLETVSYSADSLAQLRRLKQNGFLIALDDFIFRPDNSAAITFADIIKLDINKLSNDDIQKFMKKVTHRDVSFLAVKVETESDFIRCKELGFDYFQGYFFSHPEIITGKALKPGKQSVMQLLVELNNPDVEFNQLLQVISRDSVLGFTLLKLINSSMYRRATEVTSLHHALVLLGADRIRSWANLLMMSQLADNNNALLNLALIRALMCEKIAVNLKLDDEKAAFTTGLFSCLEAFTHRPMKELLEDLHLSKQVKVALIDHKGPLGEIIEAILAHEYGNWDQLPSSQISEILLATTYSESIEDADAINAMFEKN